MNVITTAKRGICYICGIAFAMFFASAVLAQAPRQEGFFPNNFSSNPLAEIAKEEQAVGEQPGEVGAQTTEEYLTDLGELGAALPPSSQLREIVSTVRNSPPPTPLSIFNPFAFLDEEDLPPARPRGELSYLGAIVSTKDLDQFIKDLEVVSKVSLERRIPCGKVWAIGSPYKVGEIMTRMTQQNMISFKGGVAFPCVQVVSELPQKYSKVAKVPTLILGVPQGEVLIEGYEDFPQIFDNELGFSKKKLDEYFSSN